MDMRAKMKITKIERHEGGQETMHLTCVARSGGYPADGSDEDNTFAKYSPSGAMTLTVANPALIGKFTPGDTYYLDFTKVTAPPKKDILQEGLDRRDITRVPVA